MKEFFFDVKPSPGSRKLDIVSTRQIPEITDLLFTTNNDVLAKFSHGKLVHFMSNGTVVHQVEDEVCKHFDTQEGEPAKIIAESELSDGNKYLTYIEGTNTDQYHVICYDEISMVTKVGCLKAVAWKQEIDEIAEHLGTPQFTQDYDIKVSREEIEKTVNDVIERSTQIRTEGEMIQVGVTLSKE